MSGLADKLFMVSLLSVLLTAASCATHKKEAVQESVKEPGATEPADTEPTKSEVIQESLQAPRQNYAQGHLQEAIDGYARTLDRYPGEPLVVQDYIQVLEKIKSDADTSFSRKKYASATKLYSLLWKNFSRFRTFQQSLSFGPKYLSRRIKDCLIARSEKQARMAARSGAYRKAAEVYKLAIQAYPEDPALKKSIIELVRDIHRKGEKAYMDKDHVQAGKMYALLLQQYGWLKNLGSPLPFSDKTLEEGIHLCRAHLTRKGLELYRKKKLKEAIALWKGLLEFDPENVEIQKAIENAEEQLKKIKKKFV